MNIWVPPSHSAQSSMLELSAPSLVAASEGHAVIERCRRGEQGAWRELYEAHFDFAWRTARRLGTPGDDVDDVVNESFEIAWRKLGDFRTGHFRTWLFRIVANVVTGKLRRRRVREWFIAWLGPKDELVAPSLESTVEARHTLARVEKVLGQLTREKRETLALFELEGLNHEEIAELTGAKVETVRTRLFYARRDFERLAREQGVEP